MGGRVFEAVMAFDFLLACAPLLRSPPERRNRHKVPMDRMIAFCGSATKDWPRLSAGS